MNYFLGADPGLSGGLAIVGDNDYAEAHKMPETDRDLWDLIAALNARYHIAYALIEELHALPKAVEEKLGIQRGSIATAKLMQHYGAIRMALIGQHIRFEEKVPRTWQKLQGLPVGGGKQASKAKAQQLFPTLKVTHATADALLIARTARILWLNAHPAERVAPVVSSAPACPVAEEGRLFL